MTVCAARNIVIYTAEMDKEQFVLLQYCNLPNSFNSTCCLHNHGWSVNTAYGLVLKLR